jgi:sigma-B regulation protein RsbU (phosphoserine phosphatase)
VSDAGLAHQPFKRGGEHPPAPPPVERRVRDIGWLPLFNDVDKVAVQTALDDCEVVLLPAGAALLERGEINHSVYLLLSGTLVVRLDEGAGHDVFAIAPGECIGELSAIDGKPASARVEAAGDARLLKLSKEIFWERLMLVPGVARNLMVAMSNRMRDTNAKTLKAQEERLELQHLKKELDMAQQLQSSMLPPQTPLFAERDDIEVCGFMEPTSDIGGDLFDAFFIDDRRLFFCIGDVSGHGIAAALFMARAIGLLRVLAMNTPQPDQLLEALNERLCTANDTNIFVTLLCGFLDVKSGKLHYSNGGHCPPILSCGGSSRLLGIPKGALIGAFPGIKYKAMEYDLEPGGILFCYTDGVTEAEDASSAEFSEQRCADFVATSDTLPLHTLLAAVRVEVMRHTGQVMLADDCTMLAIRRPAKDRI